MSTKFIFSTALLYFICFQSAFSQSYLSFSNLSGTPGIDEVTQLRVVDGESYVFGISNSAGLTVTNGSSFRGNSDITIAKYSTSGQLIFSSYLGGRGNDVLSSIEIVNGEIYLAGYTDSINFPVTNTSSYSGSRDVFVAKLNSTGNLIFSTYIGGSGSDYPTERSMSISGNSIILAGNTGSSNFPITSPSPYHGGISDIFITRLSAIDGSILQSQLVGGNKEDFLSNVQAEGNSIYLAGTTFSPDLPVTIGGPINDTAENIFVIRVNQNDLGVQYARYIGGLSRDNVTAIKIVNGFTHVTGFTDSEDFPVTNGSTGLTPDIRDGFYTRINPDGTITFSTYLATNNVDILNQLLVTADAVYAFGVTTGVQLARNVIIHKINNNGTIEYTRSFPIGISNNITPSFTVLNNEVFIAGITSSANYPTTDGSQFYAGGTAFITKLDAGGNTLISSFLGQMNTLLPILISDDKIFLVGSTIGTDYPVTNLSSSSGGSEIINIILNTAGIPVYGGYLGGSNNENLSAFAISNQQAIIAGKTQSINYPLTSNIAYKGNGDQFLTSLAFCPTGYRVSNDSLSPKTQVVCRNGLGLEITGDTVQVPSDSLPPIFRNGSITLQPPVKATYQWQTSTSMNGPFTNIPSATLKDYRPVLGAVNQYYRRLSFSTIFCGSNVVHISDTASAIVSELTAPTINAGGPFNTCPGSPVILGGNPTVSGGTPPYTNYSWDGNAAPVSNPEVAPQASSIFTLIVTDNVGCRQLGQAIVVTTRANAGPDRGACAGVPVRIGAPPLPASIGASYTWLPSTGLSSTSSSQPFANPTVVTDYSLTQTISKTGGGTCETRDTVRVTPVAAPVTQEIAGPDKVMCLKDSISLGKAPEAGFNYVWSPGSYLTTNTNSTTTFYAGNTVMPEPNPAVLYVTAQKAGCSFPDELIVSTIEARAGRDGCGPRIVGLPDRTPNINETYSWALISGNGNFTGSTNLPQVPVSASAGGPTTYGLTVTYNGGSCYDEVVVPAGCSNCQALIEVEAQYSCPSYNANGGNVTLIAYTNITNAVFSWSPAVGLSNYTGSVVHLTDNVPRIYTVTIHDLNDSSFQCSDNIFVNDPVFSRPVFAANDTVTCVGQPVTIGDAPVSGYTYEWSGAGLSSNLVSNPLATVNVQTQYPVKVSDGNGCELKDTITVAVQSAQVNAGNDWQICSSGTVTLGNPALPNITYSWEPQASPWQNGTNEFSAQPQVFVATDVDFIVTGSTPIGCISKDTVSVRINPLPTILNAPDTFVCLGNSVRIGSPSLPGVTYQWSPSTGLNNPTVAQPFANPSVTTTYTVLATFAGGCIAPATDQVTVTVGNAFFNLPNINYCPADGAFALGTGIPDGMVSYNWQPQTLVNNSTVPNPITLSPPPSNTTIFTLSVTNAQGCRYRDTIIITPLITPPVAGQDKIVCLNDTIQLGNNTNQPAPGISYSWSPVTYLDNPNSPNPFFAAQAGGHFQYIVTKTDIATSCSSTDTLIIRVIDSLVSPLPSNAVCSNSCVQIGTSPINGLQYSWSPSVGLSDPSISNPVACVGAETIVYTLTATNLNGCQQSVPVVLNVDDAISPQISVPPVIACVGDTGRSFSPVIQPVGAYVYLWTPDNGSLVNVNISNTEIRIVAPGVSLYNLQVTDSVTGCTNNATASLVVNNCTNDAVIGDYLWFDADEDGIQDSTEQGVPSITVRLFNEIGFNVASTVTGTDGRYFFSGIPSGNNYHVEFDILPGYRFTIQNAGGLTASDNSKVDDAGISVNFNLAAGQTKLDIDAGIIIDPCGPLPVTLLDFSGRLAQSEVQLLWHTSGEINNDYFDVLRSSDGIGFKKIGRVEWSGTTSVPHTYKLIDRSPVSGINYYRLRQVDTDDNSSYSKIIAIPVGSEPYFFAYYNYANSTIRINFEGLTEKMNARLFSSVGHLISEGTIEKNMTTYELRVPGVANGVYLLQLIGRKVQFAKKMVIQK